MEKQTLDAAFWNDPSQAQQVMQQIAALRTRITPWRGIEQRTRDALEFLELASEEDEEQAPALLAEIERDTHQIAADLEKLEIQVLFSGPYDQNNVILAIHAGAGGTDSQDWSAMLLRMYLRWAESHGFKTEIVDSLDGDEAGLKRVMVNIEGAYAYGYLRSERGVHRLVRLSPFDANHRRHTSFALVEVWPDVQGDIQVDIKPEEVEIEPCMPTGPGGQHMQKNATAIRLTHKPTGIVINCQSQRSQTQNRETALKILRAKLYEIEVEKQRAQRQELKGKHVEAGWGNQIRSYVLHPYKMVKDLRTDYEVGNPDAVLGGDLDGFMDAYLHYAVGSEEI